jgi:hypothetical protein
MRPQIYIDAVNDAGGFGFIAHPDHEGTKTFHVKHYPWTDWSVEGYAGISIWDFMTDWQSSLKGYIPALLSFFFPAFFLGGPRRITLERWDALNQAGKTVAIGELDNHGSLVKFGPFTIQAFAFNRAFQFIRTHIFTPEPLSGDGQKDISLLYNALRHGRCYVAMEYFQPSRGFSFVITQNSEEYSMGDTLALAENSSLRISLPASAMVKIIKDGILFAEETGKNINLPIRAGGVYRVEVYLKKYGQYRPWIFSNPVFVKQ